MAINHQNNFATNLTSGVSAGDATSPLNSIPTIAAPFYLAFDATNINGSYEVVYITSKTATNVNHAALAHNHTTAEEVRCVAPAEEFDSITSGWNKVTGTWTYASADAPTYTITVPTGAASHYSTGMRVRLTDAASTKYFIITAVADTVLTVYGGTDYTLAGGAITNPYFSTQKSPLGFPVDPTKWTVSGGTNGLQNTPTQNVWYNLGGNVSLPIGSWNVIYFCELYFDNGSGASTGGSTLSTANNSESDAALSAYLYTDAIRCASGVSRGKTITVASKTAYYLNAFAGGAGYSRLFINIADSARIVAICAYL